jgi:hypothetical protein
VAEEFAFVTDRGAPNATVLGRVKRQVLGRVGAKDCSSAPLTEPDMRTRIRLFGSIYQSASESWADAGEVSSNQRVLSEAIRPVNQAGG